MAQARYKKSKGQISPYSRTVVQIRYKKGKSNIAYIQRVWLEQGTRNVKIIHCHTLRMKPKQGTRKESPSLESYRNGSIEKAKRERERKPHGEAKPPNLLIIALFGLDPFAYIFPF